MTPMPSLADHRFAEEMLMRFLFINRVTGEEAAIAKAVASALQEVGVPASAIRHDDAHKRIPLPTQVGNLFVHLPGTVDGQRLLFSTHLDTVALCKDAKPKKESGRIVTDGSTALGGDNATGCAVLVALAQSLIKHKLKYPPITMLFTVREESGIHGARELNPKDLGGAVMGFNYDGARAATIRTGGVGQENWTAAISGKAAHAGVSPERGISSTVVAALALADVYKGGWFGKVEKPEGIGASNVGVFGGRNGQPAGDATNVVTDYAKLVGECRSRDAEFAKKIARAYESAFKKAQAEVKDAQGETSRLEFEISTSYPPFTLEDSSGAVLHAKRAAESLGLEPKTEFAKGGLDANWLVAHGVPTVTLGSGQAEIHTVKEYVELSEFYLGCDMAVALATGSGPDAAP